MEGIDFSKLLVSILGRGRDYVNSCPYESLVDALDCQGYRVDGGEIVKKDDVKEFDIRDAVDGDILYDPVFDTVIIFRGIGNEA